MIDTVIHGDAVDVIKTLEENSVDALVCDPPAGISFMGKNWDNPDTFPLDARSGKRADGGPSFGSGVRVSEFKKKDRDAFIDFLTAIMTEALRTMKPGAHGLIWALPRTSHWTACALEDSGFELRNKFYHLFGSGFPKSLNVSKSLQNQGYDCVDGLGTDVKPACEEWILVRKPLSEKTVAANVLKWGTGAINIDASRIDIHDKLPKYTISTHNSSGNTINPYFTRSNQKERLEDGENPRYDTQGRFPSHLLLSHSIFCTDDVCDVSCPVLEMDKQSGVRTSGAIKHQTGELTNNKNAYSKLIRSQSSEYQSSEGGASRYFKQFRPSVDEIAPFLYTSKASSHERDLGCDPLQGNAHPTVKPQALMRYLINLITPGQGIVLDPFAGSGSTLVAALATKHHFIGIEKDDAYCEIALARVGYAQYKDIEAWSEV